MKALFAIAVIGLGLISALSPASSQPYRERYYGFDERDYLRCNPDVWAAVRRGEFASGFQHYQTNGRREGRRLHCGERRYGGGEFDEREYLQCNPDVWAAVRRGEFASGFQHYQTFGRNEGRQLWCR
jgi:hypothetical protein